MMKGFLAIAFLLPSLALASAFPRDLSLGSRGEDVRALQKALNADPATVVATAGPGSPGNETAYFGPATKAAVVRFQEKYREQVLAPNGLLWGTGRVGPTTRTVLDQLSAASVTSVITPVRSSSSTASSNVTRPNNLDQVLAILDRAAARGEIRQADLPLMKQNVIAALSTTTDLVAEFLRDQERMKRESADLGQKLIGLVDTILGVRHVQAGLGVPFGGRIISISPCLCSNTTVIYMTPLSPSYVEALTYQNGTQLYSAYNLPLSTALKGFYAPGAGYCLVPGTPCYPSYPGRGLITPLVGSAPI